jgi:hypothetical protein
LNCVGDDQELCVAGYWTLNQTCTYGCSGGNCFICSIGDKRCNGDDREECSGATWDLLETCLYGCISGTECGQGGAVSSGGTPYQIAQTTESTTEAPTGAATAVGGDVAGAVVALAIGVAGIALYLKFK